MYTPLPFFNYSPKLFDEVQQSGLLKSECSVLRLLCFEDVAITTAEKLAITNFHSWMEKFLNNSSQVFQSGSKAGIEQYSSQYIELVLAYLLVATLYDFNTFVAADQLNKASFIGWNGDCLVRVRLLSNFLYL